MFNPFKRQIVRRGSDDPIKGRVGDARFFAEELLKAHVGTAGLHKLSKQCVRNAMMLAHALSLAVESYEAELRREALDKSLADTAFTPAPDLEEEPCDA
jgi:hypothetical protein